MERTAIDMSGELGWGAWSIARATWTRDEDGHVFRTLRLERDDGAEAELDVRLTSGGSVIVLNVESDDPESAEAWVRDNEDDCADTLERARYGSPEGVLNVWRRRDG